MIGLHDPIPNQIAKTILNKNIVIATGLLNGFWNLLILSIKGTVINPAGTAAIDNTPSNLLGITLNKLKVGKKYHSGRISRGVANGSAFSPKGEGERTDNPITQDKVPSMHTGKIYKRSFGHAG